MKLLIIRPQPGADATAKRAAEWGIKTITAPLFAAQPVAWDMPDPANYDSLMLTSANAVIHAGTGLDALKNLPVLAVGEATKAQAVVAGFDVTLTGQAGVSGLVKTAQLAGHKRILWLAGTNHSGVDPQDGMTIDTIITYQSRKLPVSKTLLEILGKPALTALHSSRAARYFSEICDQNGIDRGTHCIVALSPVIARSAGNGWRGTIVADRPDDDSLLSAASSFFTNRHSDP
jgi:uroporphyrinogen-III synthase